MEILIKVLLVTISLVLSSVAYGAAPVVLVYHDVQDESKAPFADPFTVTTQEFTSQMQWLNSQGYAFLTMEQFKQWSDNKITLPPKSVLITVDDALKSTCTTLLPLASTLDIPVVIAVVSSWIESPDPVRAGLKEYSKDMFCTWDELRSAVLYNSKVTLASHTHQSHQDVVADELGRRQPAVITRKFDKDSGSLESDVDYFKRLIGDFQESANIIALKTGVTPDVMVWPYGRANVLALKAARNAGFSYFFGLNDTPTHLTNKTFKRILLTGGLNPYLFQASLGSASLAVKSIKVEVPFDYVNSDARLGALFDRLSKLDVDAVILPSLSRNKYTGRLAWGVRSRLGIATLIQVSGLEPISDLKSFLDVVPVDGLVNKDCSSQVTAQFKRHVLSDNVVCPFSGRGLGQRTTVPKLGNALDLTSHSGCSTLEYLAQAIREARVLGVTDFILPSTVVTCAVLPLSLKKELYTKSLDN